MSTEPRVPDAPPADRRPVTLPRLAEMKRLGEPIVMITAYDFPSAQVAEEAGVDVVLVGDSAANDGARLRLDRSGLDGRDGDAGAAAVRRGARTPLIVGDLPFGSYQASDQQAVEIGGAVHQGGGLRRGQDRDGGHLRRRRRQARERLAGARDRRRRDPGDGPRRPDAAERLRARRLQGARAATARQAVQVADDALALQDAGCFAIVFEAIPAAVTETIMERMRDPGDRHRRRRRRPTARCWSSTTCSASTTGTRRGSRSASPRSSGRWSRACRPTRDEVRERRFPAAEHTYSIDPAELERFREIVAPGKPWDAADFMTLIGR